MIELKVPEHYELADAQVTPYEGVTLRFVDKRLGELERVGDPDHGFFVDYKVVGDERQRLKEQDIVLRLSWRTACRMLTLLRSLGVPLTESMRK